MVPQQPYTRQFDDADTDITSHLGTTVLSTAACIEVIQVNLQQARPTCNTGYKLRACINILQMLELHICFCTSVCKDRAVSYFVCKNPQILTLHVCIIIRV